MSPPLFVSYAQNLEDVMLYRALKNVERGFYVDIGAWRPVEDSVTKAFYDRGWNGINIEPVPDNFARMKIARPRDINLNIAIHQKLGRVQFCEARHSGTSSTIHKFPDGKLYEVQCDMLANICAAHVNGKIHFLKIDVEGAEKDVLLGHDFTKYRPWIVLIESVDADGAPCHEWEHILIESGYQFVYFDGLNRFYVSQEHSELAQAFQVPPNVFDRYVKYRETARGFGLRAWRRIESFLA